MWAKENGEAPWGVYTGKSGSGFGREIVLISGDEEYRSEEALPMLGGILARHHGFKCTVLFAIDPETGMIDPEHQTNIPGLHHLETADLMVLFTRFRELPDEAMKHIVDHTESGKPVIGLRTATHAFNYQRTPKSCYAKYSFGSREFEGGYGRQVLGETWVNHHGRHGKESTRGVINGRMSGHPILRGVDNIWGPTDVYGITELKGAAEPLVLGQVLTGMDPADEPKPDTPTMPVAWIKNYTGEWGKTSRVFCTTMGASVDFLNADLRRLFVNACYWCLGMENQIPPKSRVDYAGSYDPTFFGYGDHRRNLRPADFLSREIE